MPATMGPLVLFGARGAAPPSALEAALLEQAGGRIVVLPTGAAYERPQLAAKLAGAPFGALGGRVEHLMVLTRRDAEAPETAEVLEGARFVLLIGGSPLHLRSVLKGSMAFEALLRMWASGGIVAGSDAGATVLSDPMVDPRGGAFTVGLGLVRDVAVLAEYVGEHTPGLRRTLALAPSGCPVVALGAESALVRDPDGTWRSAGDGTVSVFIDGEPAGLGSLPSGPVATPGAIDQP